MSWQGEHGSADVLPLLLSWRTRRQENGDTRFTQFPFVWYRHKEKSKQGNLVLFPLWWDFWDKKAEKRSQTLFPIYWSRTSPEKRLLHVWPLFGWEEDKDQREISTLWPLCAYRWNDADGSQELQLPFPLIGYKSNPKQDYRHWHALPFWYTREKQDWSFGAFPLYAGRRDGDFRGSAWLWYVGKPRDKDTVRRDVALWKLYEYEEQRDGDYDFRILHKLIRSRRDGKYSELSIAPLVRVEEDRDLYRFSLLGPVIEYEKEKGSKSLRFLRLLKIPL
jgi:hypothetical protein